MNYLITGANGFIGKALIRRLSINESNSIKKIIRNNEKKNDNDTIVCDLSTSDLPESCLKNVDTIFHLAAIAHDTNMNKSSEKEYLKINHELTISLAKKAALNGVKQFIFLSSVKAGGISKNLKIHSEENQFTPNTIYGISKRNAEIDLLKLSKTINMKIKIIRSALVYGKNMKNNLNTMVVGIKNGWFPPIPNNNNNRSLVSINNLIDLALLFEKNQKLNSQILIATDKESYSTRYLYNQIYFSINKKYDNRSIPLLFFKIASKLGNLLNFFNKFPFTSFHYNKLFECENYTSNKASILLGYNPKEDFTSYLHSNPIK
jgi:UDP-glucose 4-epimerase